MFFFLLLSLPSSDLQWHHEEGNFFLEYGQPNWFISAIRSRTSLATFSDHFIFSVLLHNTNIFAPSFLVSRSLGHIIVALPDYYFPWMFLGMMILPKAKKTSLLIWRHSHLRALTISRILNIIIWYEYLTKNIKLLDCFGKTSAQFIADIMNYKQTNII